MNYKLEKFWNGTKAKGTLKVTGMNYKLEKFWNIKPYSLASSALNEL